MRPTFLEKLPSENIKFTARFYRTKRLSTARNIETLPRHQAKLILAMGSPSGACFWYTGWFTIYDLGLARTSEAYHKHNILKIKRDQVDMTSYAACQEAREQKKRSYSQ